ncbi:MULTISPECIES: lytic transglycosylase domain-containing protein [Hyphomicrobiales]|nr:MULTISPECIES: lytic transglycosylase domain-containing protein [Hyphomicrobiales]MBS7743600.1 lytic transglycosylase domain-containing protein [Chelatococcus sp. HY11]MBX3546497.1 lytic transglycosylase domain-containing protein [Chelatococcus sp.]CAH1662898.1 Lytic transglycosylase [Hyphomicrobiales bacterium]MCO5153832.1 lytic transglycosylase domain-containing protein [Shinella sp.]MCP9629978.1 lytic transglycosylase domain-containing protein [Rhodopseudomonas palustris]
MARRIAVIALGMAVACAGANAQDAATLPRVATVDASGRVLPLDPSRFRLDAAAPGHTACANAQAMAPDEARALVARIATEEKFSPDFVQSVAKNESRYNSIALSEKGAFGLMQLLPQTADRFKVDLCDPADNVRGGIRFLRSLQDKYKNLFFVLAAYNAGEEAVAKSRGVPPYPETVRFVAQVINDFNSWPTPGGDPRASAQPDVVEMAPRADAGRQRAGRQWNDGFVMHVD